ncbi:hypothetical protein PPL_07857 [Heterostelium album PN500]|uniref:Queuosine 5'-phosphate N-glycosylase/hydrolase n=1 Tax=Heterostelium pallidum (strain ATCC 26659 / Pp 5 / PN500) TaxID=670386 RepID=D3BH55_HETP5|nr:hypothetical protein PPL_07857 [Heterostelium album PN500]EFA79439.1 hypothetical protein PPL_07857 [Heterostelium album PN500]|eukprot:XP_020431560.1 hypothetical protein PPL_07857 [Heterostelium album PN500]
MGKDISSNQPTISSEVLSSAAWLSEHSKDVKINSEAIDKFIREITKDEYDQKTSVMQFPLNFSNHEQEVNFWFVLDLINFGSGYRKELHEASGRGAYDTICYGLFGMFLSQSGNINAKFFKNLSLHEVSSYFNIPISVEVQQQPGIYAYKDSPLKPLAMSIHSVLRESATIVQDELGFDDFGSFIFKFTEPSSSSSSSSNSRPSACKLTERLVNTFPAFRDVSKYGESNTPIYLYKKAQLLCGDLHRRFKSLLPERFDFEDVDQLTVFTDNVVPAVLRKYGILEVSKELEEWLDSGKELPAGDREIELRSLAIHACHLLTERARLQNHEFIGNDMKFDYFLWTKGKDGEFRKVERHYTKSIYY